MTKFAACLFVTLSLLLAFGCSSDDDPSSGEETGYYFRFKADGVPVSWAYTPHNLVVNFNLYAENNQTYTTQIAARKELATADRNQFSIFIVNSAALQSGISYSDHEAAGQTVPDFLFRFGYFDPDGLIYTTDQFGAGTVVFTGITENSVTGTFSGTMTAVDTSSGTVKIVDTITITEGTFHVPRF
ncbi:MAG: hypothetical protein AAGU19_07160 [Prolixibacteraceae bacterium]